MKTTIIFSIATMLSLNAGAQILNVKSIEQINIPEGEATSQVVGFSPQGDYLLLSSSSKQGLIKFDLAQNEATTLSEDNGAGVGAQISADGKNIIYRARTVDENHLVFTSVKSINLTTMKKQELVAPTRDLQAMSVESGGTAVTVTGGKLRARSLKDNSSSTALRPIISNVNLHLELTVNGVTEKFAPQGDNVTYIWASISPNGERVLYYVGGVGCFTCRLDQSDMLPLGLLRAPQWLNDDVVIGMYDKDDGVTTTESSIIAKTLNGVEQRLTDENVIAMYPYSNAVGNKIAFSTPFGEAYIINVE